MKLLKVSPSPFVKRSSTVNVLMIQLVIALLIINGVGVYFVGYKSSIVLAISLVSALLFEFVYNLVVYEKKWFTDWSCVITALLFSSLAPANLEWYIPIIAMFFSIIIAKMVFGGNENAMFHSTAMGILFVMLFFPNVFNSWSTALGSEPSSMTLLLNGNYSSFNILKFLYGKAGGSLGTACAITVLVCALYLIAFGVIDFKMPLVALIAYLFMALCMNDFDINCLLPYLFTGIILFVSFFMLTDYATSPNTNLGQFLYALIFGVLSAVFIKLNLCGEMGVIIALLIADCFTPLFDRIIRPHYFGEGKQ